MDLASLDDLSSLDAIATDVCVIGSGAAGLSIASELSGRREVLVVESGQVKRVKALDDALQGEVEPHLFDGLINGRVRVLGGATKLWFGQCIRLDEIDFETRPWVPYSGWPIEPGSLKPFYERAESLLGLKRPRYGQTIWQDAQLPTLEHPDVPSKIKFTAYNPEPDFTRLFARKPIQVLLDATVVQINGNETASKIESVTVCSLGGVKKRILANIFILCCGGLENARLLLASNHLVRSGLGNGKDLVGRFLQDHPAGLTGTISSSEPFKLQNQFRKRFDLGQKVWPKIALGEAAQRDCQLLNSNSYPLYHYADDSPLSLAKGTLEAFRSRNFAATGLGALRLLPHAPSLALQGGTTLFTGKAPIFAPFSIELQTHVEQAPDPENRVTLGGSTDRFGIPVTKVSWRVGELELRTMEMMARVAGNTLERNGLGTVKVHEWLLERPAPWMNHLVDTYHHAGTTRMAHDPSSGVVDPNGKVFGIANLYVMGSSIFPTSGYANPTLTIVALALRLCDFLLDIQRQKRVA